MSRRSQEKRAARAKVRARQRARGGEGHPPDGPGLDADFVDLLRSHVPPQSGVTTSDVLHWARDGAVYGLWRQEAEEIAPAVFQAEAEPVLVSWLRELYNRAGWQPTELIRHMGRRGKVALVGLTQAIVAAERDSRSGPTLTDPGWLRQWDAAELPEVAGPGWLAAWAASHPDWLKLIHRYTMFLAGLPALDSLLMPPSGAKGSRVIAPGYAPAAAHPILERVRALLAKAESTPFESEAITYTAKAQELMTKYALDQAMLAGSGADPAVPGVIRIPVDPPYLDAKALLLQVIAGHSRCRAVLHQDVEMSSVIGFPTDLETVELLFASLLVQAHHAMAEAAAAAPPGSRTRSQSFRAAFLSGFANRIDVRLGDVNTAAFDEAKAQSGTFLPVLRSREERIDQFMGVHFSALTSSRVRGGIDPLGYHHGQLAGDAAALLAGAVEG